MKFIGITDIPKLNIKFPNKKGEKTEYFAKIPSLCQGNTFLPHHMIYSYLSKVPLDLAAIYTHIFHGKRVGVYRIHVYSVIILYQLKKMHTQSYTPQRFFLHWMINYSNQILQSSDINRKIPIETHTFPRSCVIAIRIFTLRTANREKDSARAVPSAALSQDAIGETAKKADPYILLTTNCRKWSNKFCSWRSNSEYRCLYKKKLNKI